MILQCMENNRRHILHTKNGYYYGTEKGGVWWKRYWRGGWLARGNSEVWVDTEGLFFRRYLTKKIMHIPLQDITGTATGSWHAGKWFGAPVIKITWEKDDMELVSGFTISWKKEETEKWIAAINDLSKQKKL